MPKLLWLYLVGGFVIPAAMMFRMGLSLDFTLFIVASGIAATLFLRRLFRGAKR